MSERNGNPVVLVAGGAGFLGSHLCRHLLDTDHDIICVDDLSTGRGQNIKDLQNHPRFTFANLDITLDIGSYSILSLPVDEIYNLACPASPPFYQADPVGTWETCILGTQRLADLALKWGSTFLQASTSEVYGDPLQHPQTESYWGNVNPLGKRSCYDEGKRAAETMLYTYREQYNADIKIARIFNTYGPAMRPDDGRVVTNFVIQALKNEPLTIYGTGTQTRSFCYVGDLIRGLVALMKSPSAIMGPVNLGNPTEMTMVDLAKLIIKLTGSSSPISYRSLPEDDPKKRQPDIRLAKSTLGWEPEIELETGLLEIIKDFKQYI